MAGKKQNMFHMWKKLMKIDDLGEPTSFLDHVYLGCTQRENQKKQLLKNIRKCSNHKFLLEQLMLRDIANWRTRRQQLYEVSTPCLDDDNFEEEESETVGDVSKVCS